MKAAPGIAYGVPGVRIFAQSWFDEAAYSFTAVVADDQDFRPLLQRELEKRLSLVTHGGQHDFKVWVLKSKKPVAPAFERAARRGARALRARGSRA